MPQEETLRFLGNFRSKYPEYDDLDDATLLSNIQRKYPEYDDLTLDAPAPLVLGKPRPGQELLFKSLQDPSQLSDDERRTLGMLPPERSFAQQFFQDAPREMLEGGIDLFKSADTSRGDWGVSLLGDLENEINRFKGGDTRRPDRTLAEQHLDKFTALPQQAMGALGVGLSVIPAVPAAFALASNVAQTLASGGAAVVASETGFPLPPEIKEASDSLMLSNFKSMGTLAGDRANRPSASGHTSDAIDLAVDIITGLVPLGEVAAIRGVTAGVKLVSRIFGASTLQAAKIITRAELDQVMAAKILPLVEGIEFRAFNDLDEQAVLGILASRRPQPLRLTEGQARVGAETRGSGWTSSPEGGAGASLRARLIDEGVIRPATEAPRPRGEVTVVPVEKTRTLRGQSGIGGFSAGRVVDGKVIERGRLPGEPESITVPVHHENLVADAAAALRREEGLEQTRTIGGNLLGGRPALNLSVYDTGVPPGLGEIPKAARQDPATRLISEAAEADPVLAREATVSPQQEEALAMIQQLNASGRTQEAATMQARHEQARKSMVTFTEDALRAQGFEKEADIIVRDLEEAQKAIDEGRIARQSIDPAAVEAKAEARIAEQKTKRPTGCL
jgi:hypothetical protein